MIVEIAALLIGTLCVVLGYKLLMRAVHLEGDAKALGDSSVLIKRSAPGAIFALFGAAMIVMALLHGSALRHHQPAAAAEEMQTEQAQTGKQTSSAQPAKRKHVRDENRKPRVLPQQAEQPAKTAPGEFTRDDQNQPAPPAKTWKPGRA